MKKLNLLFAGIVVMGALSCSDDDNSSSNNNNNNNTTQVVNAVKSGSWKITKFEEDTNVETQHFNGYNFTFGDNNVVTATNGTNTYTGTWSISNDSSSDDDDSNSSDIDFNIAFSAPDEFTDLTDDWDIVESSGAKISLIDVSGGNGGTDYLIFEKI